jgi:ATP-dependent DNA helicase RecQ
VPSPSSPLADNPHRGEPLHDEAEGHLHDLAGEGAGFRPDQFEAIEALVRDHRRVLTVQRTGWGKSAVYFVSTALLRSRGSGPALIVSPLLALMRNQIAAAERAGIRAVTINSTNVEEWNATYAAITAGDVDLLLLSPERLNNPGFRDNVLPRLAATCGLLVVDEAHCISDWGHDFRPDYRRIRTLLSALAPGTPVLATTATANARVVDDVADVLQLGDEGAGPGSVLVQRGPLDRASLHLSVLDLPDQAHRLAWLAEHLGSLQGSGIIYTLTVAASTEVADYLRACGHEVAAYSGRTDPTERAAAEQALLDNEVKALVATSALGMGFDKGDLAFVIHLGAPPSPIAYYQQIGRAGRATARAEVTLLPGPEDRAIWDYFASMAFPGRETVRALLSALSGADDPMSTPALETVVDLSRSRLEATLKVLDVEGAVRRVSGGWVATGETWSYDTERYAKVARTRTAEAEAMVAYTSTTRCRMRFLLDQLDDPYMTEDCGRCDNCTGRLLSPATSDAALSKANDRLARPGVPIEMHKLWPSNMSTLGVEVSGRIAASDAAEPGRAVARFSDLGWGPRVRAVADATVADGPVPEALVRAAVEVLAGWKSEWPERPAAFVWVGSQRHPELVASLAQALGSIGHLPVLGQVVHRGSARPSVRTNSAQRLAALWGTFSLDPAVAAALAGECSGRGVILVDDMTDSGWTLTAVARLLRHAGAAAVYPLTLGVAA